MASKQQLILGAWTAAGGIAGITTYRALRDFENRHPYVPEAVNALAASAAARGVLGNGSMQLARWPRHGKVDEITGRACAGFDIYGDRGFVHVCVGARRELPTVEEEEEDEVSGWRYYWSKPWELKFRFLELFRSRGLDQPDENTPKWDIDALFFLPNGDASCPHVLRGDPRGIPEYETLCARRDVEVKDERSQRRLRWLVAAVMAGALTAGGVQLARSWRVSRSFRFVRQSLSAHGDITAAVGGQVGKIRTVSGSFGAKYIDARVQVIGVSGTAVDVDIAALRDGGEGPWRVALARMRSRGGMYNLDKTQFQVER